MRDVFGYIFLALLVLFAAAAVLAALRPGLFSRRRPSAASQAPARPGDPLVAADAQVPDAIPTASATASVPYAVPTTVPASPLAAPPTATPVPPTPGSQVQIPAPAPAAQVQIPAPTPAQPAQIPAFAPTAPRRNVPLIAGLSGAAVVCAALTYVLLLMPVYSVEVVPPEQVVAAPGSIVLIEVANSGAMGGTFESEPTLDGEAIAEVAGGVGAGSSAVVEVVLPDDLTPGEHTLVVDGVEYRFAALTPPDYRVGKLKVEPSVVKPKQEVTVTVTVKNRGEATGDYPGTLTAAGKEVGATETEIVGGEAEIVRVSYEPQKLGKVKLAVGESKVSLMVVKPFRPASGAVLANSAGGGGNLMVFQNRYPEDAMFCLTTAKASRKPVLSVFVRGKKTASVDGLRAGSYYVFYSVGEDWNRYTDDFLTSYGRARFGSPCNLQTRSWTSSSVDYSARMIYTTRYTQNTRFTITIGGRGSGKPAKAVEVSGAAFPAP